jgi:hypothetical protein
MASDPLTPHYHHGPSRFIAITLFFLISGAFALQARAQKCGANAQSPISTDRPQVTNSSLVVPCGSLQFENGFEVTGTGGQHSPDFPETSIRFGIAVKTELRISVPNYFQNDAAASGTDGFGDLSLGLKQQFGPIAGFDISLIPSLSLPIGANSISSHGYDPTVQLPWSRSLTKSWTVAGQFGVTWPTESGQRNVAGQISLYVDRQLTSPWDAYVEYSGAFPRHGGPAHQIDFGTAYKPTAHQQLDLHCGFGLSSAVSDYSVGFGYSVRFQVIRQK